MSRFRFRFFSVLADAVSVNAAVLAALLLRFFGYIPQSNFDAYLFLLPFLTLTYLACGWLYDLYDPEQLDSPWSTTAKVLPAAILGTIGLTAFAFLGGAYTVAFPRLTLPVIFALCAVFMLGWRLLFLRFGRISWPEQRTLVIGSDDIANDLVASIAGREKWGWKLVDQVSSRVGLSQINSIIENCDINRIIIAAPDRKREFIEQLVLAEHTRLTIDVVPELYETFIGHTQTIIGDIPLMRIASGTPPRYQRWLKRLIDIIGAVLLLLVTLPILLVSAIAILLTDGGPVLYRQERTGLNQRPFKIIKFRTMIKNAEASSGPVLATEHDPRITAVGQRLRTYRIDELPQMINILRGEMSFIGPRPERPVFVEEYIKEIPGYSERFRTKPGVTGLAQVNGGYATTPERKLKYDLMYLYHQSLGLDAQVIVETIKVVLVGKGAR